MRQEKFSLELTMAFQDHAFQHGSVPASGCVAIGAPAVEAAVAVSGNLASAVVVPAAVIAGRVRKPSVGRGRACRRGRRQASRSRRGRGRGRGRVTTLASAVVVPAAVVADGAPAVEMAVAAAVAVSGP